MIIPEVQIKKYVDAILSSIQKLCLDFQSNACVIPQIFTDDDVLLTDSLGDYSFKEQAQNIFVDKSGASPKTIQSRISFDPARAHLPTIHITIPSEENTDRSIGDDPEPTEDGYRVANNFRSTFECVITGQNPFEVVTIYRVMQSMMIGTLDVLSHMGFYNPTLSGGDLHIASDSVPQGIFARSIKIQASYENRFPLLPIFKKAVNQIIFGGAFNDEYLESEINTIINSITLKDE